MTASADFARYDAVIAREIANRNDNNLGTIEMVILDKIEAGANYPNVAAYYLEYVRAAREQLAHPADFTRRCATCDGEGVVEVPSMLGYGTETYPCTHCNMLNAREAAQVLANTSAEIDRAIR